MPDIEKSNQVVRMQHQDNADKPTRFVTVASKRTNNVLNHMDSLQKCFDQIYYDYTDGQITKNRGHLRQKLPTYGQPLNVERLARNSYCNSRVNGWDRLVAVPPGPFNF